QSLITAAAAEQQTAAQTQASQTGAQGQSTQESADISSRLYSQAIRLDTARGQNVEQTVGEVISSVITNAGDAQQLSQTLEGVAGQLANTDQPAYQVFRASMEKLKQQKQLNVSADQAMTEAVDRQNELETLNQKAQAAGTTADAIIDGVLNVRAEKGNQAAVVTAEAAEETNNAGLSFADAERWLTPAQRRLGQSLRDIKGDMSPARIVLALDKAMSDQELSDRDRMDVIKTYYPTLNLSSFDKLVLGIQSLDKLVGINNLNKLSLVDVRQAGLSANKLIQVASKCDPRGLVQTNMQAFKDWLRLEGYKTREELASLTEGEQRAQGQQVVRLMTRASDLQILAQKQMFWGKEAKRADFYPGVRNEKGLRVFAPEGENHWQAAEATWRAAMDACQPLNANERPLGAVSPNQQDELYAQGEQLQRGDVQVRRAAAYVGRLSEAAQQLLDAQEQSFGTNPVAFEQNRIGTQLVNGRNVPVYVIAGSDLTYSTPERIVIGSKHIAALSQILGNIGEAQAQNIIVAHESAELAAMWDLARKEMSDAGATDTEAAAWLNTVDGTSAEMTAKLTLIGKIQDQAHLEGLKAEGRAIADLLVGEGRIDGRADGLAVAAAAVGAMTVDSVIFRNSAEQQVILGSVFARASEILTAQLAQATGSQDLTVQVISAQSAVVTVQTDRGNSSITVDPTRLINTSSARLLLASVLPVITRIALETRLDSAVTITGLRAQIQGSEGLLAQGLQSVQVVTADGFMISASVDAQGKATVQVSGIVTRSAQEVTLNQALELTPENLARFNAIAQMNSQIMPVITGPSMFAYVANEFAKLSATPIFAGMDMGIHAYTAEGTLMQSTVTTDAQGRVLTIRIIGQRTAAGQTVYLGKDNEIVIRVNADGQLEDVAAAEDLVKILTDAAAKITWLDTVQTLRQNLLSTLVKEARSDMVSKLIASLAATAALTPQAPGYAAAKAQSKQDIRAFRQQSLGLKETLRDAPSGFQPTVVVINREMNSALQERARAKITSINHALGYNAFDLQEVEEAGQLESLLVRAERSGVDRRSVIVVTDQEHLIAADLGVRVLLVNQDNITTMISSILPALLTDRGLQNSGIQMEINRQNGQVSFKTGKTDVAETVDSLIDETMKEDAHY
ncbi:MAG: hypothetical protein WCG06_00225, partial [Candidatus Omnitrophota bacterium]